jgi:hypothetical protein
MDDLIASTVNTVKGPGSGGSLDERLDHILAVLMETRTICEQHRKEIVALKAKGKIIYLEKGRTPPSNVILLKIIGKKS